MLDKSLSFDAEEAMKRLAKKGVGSRPFFCPMHQQPVLRRRGLFEGKCFPVAENMYRRGLYIPSGMALSDDQMERVAREVRELVE